MNYIARDTDVILNNNDLEDLYSFKNFPVFMGCVESSIEDDIMFDMNWKISKKSGAIQLNPLLPLDIVYNSEHGSGTVGKSWDEHHQSFANFVNKFKGTSILEIGGLHGILAQKCLQSNPELNWTIVEPNPIIPDNISVKVIQGFFDNDFTSEEKFDTIIHSHVLEHIYNPDEFMNYKSSFMNEGDNLIFSIPNMEVMLKNKYTNCINFEHTIYFTEPYIEYMLAKYGFKLIEKEYFKKDHSIFYYAQKSSEIQPIELSNKLYKLNKITFEDYIISHIKDVNTLNQLTSNSTLPVYIFGAHVFTQYLISFGLDTSKVVCLLDNDFKKENKRLYGTQLISQSPKILKNVPEALVILRAGVYNEEIKNDILTNINPNITFI
jgi:2-polyprenyl-3-methyl-5-hydroxy-6-metoxy-1,4-benzoquinol methylase